MLFLDNFDNGLEAQDSLESRELVRSLANISLSAPGLTLLASRIDFFLLLAYKSTIAGVFGDILLKLYVLLYRLV